jgi:phospholipase/carboxylesterase
MDDGYVYHEEQGSGADAPLLFLFHGTGGDETQFLSLARQLRPGAHLVAPRGDVSEQGANRYFRRTGEGVYDMADLARATDKMVRFVRAHRNETNASQVLGLGYSNGANILASVLFEAPELFDAAVLMHPLIPFTPPPQPGLAGRRVLITAGRRDPICPPPATEALAAWLEAQGATTELFWHSGGHEIAQTELAAVAAFLSPA